MHACASGLGVALEPMHPSTPDPELAAFLVARVAPERVEGVVETLLGCEGVDGAYPKPPGEPPERTVEDAG